MFIMINSSVFSSLDGFDKDFSCTTMMSIYVEEQKRKDIQFTSLRLIQLFTRVIGLVRNH